MDAYLFLLLPCAVWAVHQLRRYLEIKRLLHGGEPAQAVLVDWYAEEMDAPHVYQHTPIFAYTIYGRTHRCRLDHVQDTGEPGKTTGVTVTVYCDPKKTKRHAHRNDCAHPFAALSITGFVLAAAVMVAVCPERGAVLNMALTVGYCLLVRLLYPLFRRWDRWLDRCLPPQYPTQTGADPYDEDPAR